MSVLHSFGGSALDRHVFDFETTPDGDPGVPGLEPIEVPGGEPPAGEPWALSQDDWTAYQEQQAQIAQTVETLAQLEAARAAPYMPAPQQPNEAPMPDPWNRPETYEQDLRAWGDSLVAPFQQRFTQLDEVDGQERLTDVLHDLETAKGEFLEPTRNDMYALAKSHARELYPQFAARMGGGDDAAEAALEAAFDYARGVEQKLVEAAVARHTNEIATLAGAPRPAGTQYGEGLAVRTVPDWRLDRRSVADKLLDEASR